MLLARESLALDRSLQTEGTLLATLLREPAVTGTFTVPIEDRPQQVRVSPDGRTIAVTTNNNVMRFYDTRTHRQIRTMPLINADYIYVPSTGHLFAAAPGSTPAYKLFDPRTGKTLGTFILSKLWQTTPSTPFEPAIVTSDGRYAFVIWAVWNQDGSEGETYAEAWRLEPLRPVTPRAAASEGDHCRHRDGRRPPGRRNQRRDLDLGRGDDAADLLGAGAAPEV